MENFLQFGKLVGQSKNINKYKLLRIKFDRFEYIKNLNHPSNSAMNKSKSSDVEKTFAAYLYKSVIYKELLQTIKKNKHLPQLQNGQKLLPG